MAFIQPLKRHPLLTYFVLVYVLAWAFWIPLALIHPFSNVLNALGDSMPSLLGILLTALFSGTSSLSELFGRLGRVRVPLIWYAVVLLLLPALWLIAVGIPTLLGLATITSPGAGFIVFTGGAGIAEELGWRGFALPRLQARQSALTASLLLGVLWGLWHLPWRIALGLPLTAAGLVQFLIYYPLMLTAWSVLMTWVYNNTRGSLLLMVLFHAFGNMSLNLLTASGTFLGTNNGIAFILYVILLWIAVLLVVVLAGPARLTRLSSSAPALEGESLFEDR
jgi:membrane protease YdiL (CAAX protease family)